MSCYNWEKGWIKLPAFEYKWVKAAMYSYLTDKYTLAYNEALKLRDVLLNNAKGKRLFDYETELDRLKGHAYFRWFYPDEYKHGKKPAKPKKQNMSKIYDKKNLKIDIDYGNACIHFCDKTKIIYWEVDENNRAVESAHESPETIKLFRLLNIVKWSNRTGGYFIGNDEYNRNEGDGQNYVTHRFGAYANKKSRLFKEVSLRG